jgi:hypothetical protein
MLMGEMILAHSLLIFHLDLVLLILSRFFPIGSTDFGVAAIWAGFNSAPSLKDELALTAGTDIDCQDRSS